MKTRFAVLVLAALFATAAHAAPVPLGTVVKAPDWTAGSEWHYSDGYAVKVNSVSAKGAMFERLDAPGQWFMRQGFIKTDSASSTATRNAIYRTVPDTAGLSLSAGKPLTFQREYLNNGKLLVHASSWTVEGRETITVPAGSFDCWVIVWRTRSMKSDWTGFERWWYSPQAQNYVRMEYKYGPDEDGSRVLMTYNLAGHLAGAQPAPVAAPVMPVTPQALPVPIPSAAPAPVALPKPAPAIVVTAPVKDAPVPQRDVVSEPAPNKDGAVALMLAPGKSGGTRQIKTAMLAAPSVRPGVKDADVAVVAPALTDDQLRDDTSAVALMLAPGKSGGAGQIKAAVLAAPSIRPGVKDADLAVAAPALTEDQLRDDTSAVALMLAPHKSGAVRPVEVAALTAPSVQPSVKNADVAAIAPVLAKDQLPAELPQASALLELAKVEITPAKEVAAAAPVSVKDEPLPTEILFASGPASSKPEPVKVAEAEPSGPRALPKGDKSGPWHAQLGASLDAANVRTSLKKILARNPGAHELPNGVTVREVEGRTFYRAWLGSYDTAPEARSLCDALNIKKVRISGCTVFKGPTTMEARAN